MGQACSVRPRATLGALAIVGFLGCLNLGNAARAQTPSDPWPQRTVKFILPFGAGSATDAAARLMSDKLAARWGKPIVIENKPGADGLLAISAFVQANDDHVLLYASSASFNAHPYMHEKLSYNLERDLLPIAQVTDTILTAAVPAASKATTLKEFVALAKAEPNTLNAAGAAGVPDFTLGYFLKSENLPVTKVPYRDIVPAASDLAGNQIQFLLSSMIIVRPLAQAGKVRLLAVTRRERVPLIPDVPTGEGRDRRGGRPGDQREAHHHRPSGPDRRPGRTLQDLARTGAADGDRGESARVEGSGPLDGA
jgi:tripartite-type tricarboxylate transporter receptor subunit TctC